MLLETFRGHQPHDILAKARAALGDDACVVRTRPIFESGERLIEMVVAPTLGLADLRGRMEEPTPTWPERTTGSERPHKVALVGPTGVGKTTTAAKLAVHPQAYGKGRPGLLCLDTYRVAAVEQLGSYAEAAGLPMEVVYGPDELDPSLHRLGACDVVLIDTPGRGPGDRVAHAECAGLLRRIEPDEVHLLLPAYLNVEAAGHLMESYAPYGVTHLLLTKLDEAPDPITAAGIALQSDLRSRWVTDGQSVPRDLGSARTSAQSRQFSTAAPSGARLLRRPAFQLDLTARSDVPT